MPDGAYDPADPHRTAADGPRTGHADVLSWLLQRWIFIAGVSSVCAALAYAASFLIPPSYVATASLFVDSRGIQPLAAPAGQQQSGDNNFEVSSVESQAKIITSRSVLSRVVADQRLVDDPSFIGNGEPTLIDRIRELIGAAPAPPLLAAGRRLKALQSLAECITVRRPERTFIIDVSARAQSPDVAARLANAVAQAYFDEQSAARADKARRANEALTSRLDELRDRLRRSEARAQAFKDEHGLVGTRLQLSSEQQLTEANAQLAQARTQRVQSLAHLDDLSRPASGRESEGDTPEALASPTISELRGKQADAKRQLRSALAQLGPRHPTIRDAKEQIAGLDQSIQFELGRIRRAAQLRYQRAAAAEKASKAIVDVLSVGAADTSGALAQSTQLQEEVDINRNLLNTFLSRSREMGEIEQLDSSTARMISQAEPPFNRAFPPRGIVFVVVGAALGFLIAAARIVLQRAGFPSARIGRLSRDRNGRSREARTFYARS